MNKLIKQLSEYTEDIEVIATNLTAEAYKPILAALNNKPTDLDEFVKSMLIIAGAMQLKCVDFKDVENLVRANKIRWK